MLSPNLPFPPTFVGSTINTFMMLPPIPENEMERILALSEFNIDFSNPDTNFKELTRLAAKVAGADISFVNLIDSYTQWTISYHGMENYQMTREDSVCQYTIMESDHFEVKNLAQDSRFADKFYVKDDPNLRYYFGIPLRFENYNLGALCVLDKGEDKNITPEKAEMLKIIGEEVVNRLKVIKHMEQLRANLNEANSTQNKILHDIRGPIGGIMGLAQIISMQGNSNSMEEVLDLINLIYKGGKSVLELADEILENDRKRSKPLKGNELTLVVFKDKLEKLYQPQAKSKNIKLSFATTRDTEEIVFPQNKLMQIAGNLISNAIKFTPAQGSVSVSLAFSLSKDTNLLRISVKDTGAGIPPERVAELLADNNTSTNGTSGETGYGFGLALVKHLVQGLKGSFNISSTPPNGAEFIVELPFANK